MTVSQLIEELGKMPSDSIVLIEGCDCDGHAGGVEEREDNTILITRP